MPVVVRGRSDAIARALEVLRHTTADGGSAVLTISGPPGIGKTTVRNAIVTEAIAGGFRVGSSKAEEIGQIAPGAPLFMALRSGSRPLMETSRVVDWEALTDEPMRLVEPISDGLERAAGTAPVLVAIDDTQWVDPLSRTMLRALIGRMIGSPIVWLLVARTSGAEVLADLTAMTGPDVPVTGIELGPLGFDDLVRIAHDRLGSPPSAAVRRTLRDVGGNPLVAMQIVEGSHQARRRGQSEGRAPTEFLIATRERHDQLDSAAAEIVDLAAVFGRPFTLDELAALQSEPAPILVPAVDRAVASDFLWRDGNEIRFSHDLLRETIYAGIPDQRRRTLHMRCAHYLVGPGKDLLASAAHVRAGAKVGDENSAAFLRRAAAHATTSMPESAGQLVLDALSLLRPAQPAWIVAAEESVDLLCRVERYADAIRIAELALSRAADPETNARLHVLMARAMFSTGVADQSVRRLDAALSERSMSRAAHARLVSSRALALTRVGQAARARTAVTEALDLARGTNDKPATLIALHARGEFARNSGHHAEAMDAMRELRLAGDDQPFVAEELYELQMLDRYDESERMLARAAADPQFENNAPLLWAQMWQDFNLCRLDEAELDARQLIATSRELGGHMLEIDAYVVFSSTALLRGDLAKARRRLEERELQSRTDDRLRQPSVRLLHGWIAAAEGRSGEATSILTEELRTAHESRTYWPWWPGWMPLLTHFGMSAGDPNFISKCLDLAGEGASRNPGIASFEGLALHVQGLTTTNLDLLEQAARVLGRSPRPELRAYALADLGRALIRNGHLRDGIAHLDEAWDTYHAIGMYAALNSVQRLMRQAGARRVKWAATDVARPTSGWAALTPTELQVAELISAGRTNRAAALHLGISPNTIGTHLRSIFDKLGVHSRVQLSNLHHRRSETVSR